jgi:hypothetical protein
MNASTMVEIDIVLWMVDENARLIDAPQMHCPVMISAIVMVEERE